MLDSYWCMSWQIHFGNGPHKLLLPFFLPQMTWILFTCQKNILCCVLCGSTWPGSFHRFLISLWFPASIEFPAPLLCNSQYLMKKNNLMLWIHQSCSVFKKWNRNNWMKNQSKRRERSEMATNARIGTPTDKDQRPLCATLLWMSCEWLRLVYA